MPASDRRLRDLQLLTILVPALCAGIYETVRHSLLPSDLPYGLGTIVAVALVLVISSAFARISFQIIRGMEARLLERNRQLQALSRDVERLAVLEERDRLAREMHDGVAQVLASMLVRLDTVEGLVERGRYADVALEVSNLRESGAEAYADVRESIADLRVRPEAGPVGLRRALDVYVSQFGERTGIQATFEAGSTDGAVEELSPMAEIQLLRIVQEALANVRKHSDAERVNVRFWRDSGGWHVLVRDDGHGFDPRAVNGHNHFGLAIMRERAERAGGTLEITSVPGQGTTLEARLPLGASDDQDTRRQMAGQGVPRGAAATAPG